jgi:hypothetical protein
MEITVCDTYFWNGNTYSESGTYTFTTQNSQGCDSVVTLHLTISPLDLSTTTNNNVITSNQNNANYQWFDCNLNTIIEGATGQTYAPTSNGSYSVIIESNGCIDTSDCVNITTIGIDNFENQKIKVYPNPTLDIVNIIVDAEYVGETFRIYDKYGKLIMFDSIDDTHLIINISHLANGVYIIKISNISIKVVKQ